MDIVELDPDRDAEALHAVLGDPDSCRYLPRPAQPHVHATRALLRHWHDGWEDTDWAIRVDGITVGRIGLFSRRDGVWEAACLVVPAARGQRLAARTLPQAIDYVFATKGAHRVEADIDPDNTASLRVFESLGFRREGRLRHVWKTHIGLRDSVVYGLLRDDPRPWVGSPARDRAPVDLG